MTEIVLNVYKYLSLHKKTRNALLVLSTIILLLLGSQVTYEEDITKLLPSTNNGNEKLAFSNLRVKDKIYILVAPQNGEEIDPDEMVEISDEFVENLLEKDTATHYVADVLYKIDEDEIIDAVTYLCDNFAVFVGEDAYETFDKLTTKESIDSIMKVNYETLASVEGMAMADMIASDPIGMRNVLLGKFSDVKQSMGSSHAIYDSHFFTPDTTIAVAYISPNFKSFDSKSGTLLTQLIENSIEEIEAEHPGVKVYYHGAPIQSVYNSKQIKKDLSMTVALSLAIICLVIIMCFKNISTLPMMLAPVVYGAFFALTMMYLIKGTMSLLALGIGAIVLGVALSYCLHVITHYKYVSTPERVLQDQAKPVFLGCLTTIGSFLGLLFTQSELLRDFGLFASFALLGTTFFSLVFLPHFFNPARNKKSKKAFVMLEKINSHPFEKHNWLIASIVVLCCVCLYTQRWASDNFDANLKNIGYFEPKIAESMKLFADKTQSGYTTTYYAAASENLDSAIQKTRRVSGILDELRASDKIHGYSKTASLFLTTEEQEENIERWNEYWTEEKINEVMLNIKNAAKANKLIPEFFVAFENVLKNDYEPVSLFDAEVIPEGLLANMIEYNDSIYMVFTPVQLKEEMKNEVGHAIVDNVDDCIVIDPMFYTTEMVETIKNDFNVALYISMAFVFIVLLLSFKDIILSIVAFIPMTLSWYIVLGVMGMLGLQFNLINIVISTFIFGIGVDYSIFVMEGLLSKAKSMSEPQLLVYHKTAIFFSAVVLIVSTGSLLLATHPALHSIGIATIIGMSSAVALAYTLQPFLFHMIVKFMLKKGIKTKWLNN